MMPQQPPSRPLLLLLPIAVAVLLPAAATGFLPPSPPAARLRPSPLGLADPSLLDQDGTAPLLSLITKYTDPETAKGEFLFFLLGGSGAGGIGLAQIPRIYNELSSIRALGGEGPTEGGPSAAIGVSSLLYPPLSAADLGTAVAKVPTAAQISAQGTSESYLASRGYVDRADFVMACRSKGCNPLASYALFEALSGGSGGCVSPVVMEDKLAEYREAGGKQATVDLVLGDLTGATATKLGAYGGLAFVLFLIFALIADSGMSAIPAFF